jgi:hypothetical protein
MSETAALVDFTIPGLVCLWRIKAQIGWKSELLSALRASADDTLGHSVRVDNEIQPRISIQWTRTHRKNKSGNASGQHLHSGQRGRSLALTRGIVKFQR